jgi:hypothetical protein
MTTPSQPPAGLIGLTSISGDAGKLIKVGQWLNGDGFRDWEHAFMSIGGGLVVEAEPGGARVARVSEYSVIHWCYGLYSLGTPGQHANAAFYARKYTEAGPWGPHGVPYSFLDYAALAARRLHIPAPGLQAYIASSEHQICSQLADQCDSLAGIHIFTDGRWPGYVDPLSLYNRDLELGSQSRLVSR